MTSRHPLVVAPLLACLWSACGGAGPQRIHAAARLEQELRPDTPGNAEMFRYGSGDTVEHLDDATGAFRIHYTRTGPNAVPLEDGDMDGTPDHVAAVAALYGDVAAFYSTTLGFRTPLSDDGRNNNGGDGRFDVYLLDFALSADGAFRQDLCTGTNPDQCIGYMVQENDFAGYGYPSVEVGNRVLSSHEFFHAVQAAYDANQGSVLAEGTAVWATEKFDPTLDDFEGFIPAFFLNPDHSLDLPLPGPVDPFSYGSAVFFKFLDEKYGTPVIRELWEACENGHGGVPDPAWLAVLDGVLQGHSSNFPAALSTFAAWNLQTGRYAATGSYAAANTYPLVKTLQHSAPVEEPALRVFYASSQYHAVAPGGRQHMTAKVLETPAHPGQLQDLRLVLAVRRDTDGDAPIIINPATEEVPVLDTTFATFLVVGVINTAVSGSSLRPALCVGTPEEVAACESSLGGAPDAGVTEPDAGSTSSSSDAGSQQDTNPGPFHCAAGSPPAAFMLVLALLLRPRRRAC